MLFLPEVIFNLLESNRYVGKFETVPEKIITNCQIKAIFHHHISDPLRTTADGQVFITYIEPRCLRFYKKMWLFLQKTMQKSENNSVTTSKTKKCGTGNADGEIPYYGTNSTLLWILAMVGFAFSAQKICIAILKRAKN